MEFRLHILNKLDLTDEISAAMDSLADEFVTEIKNGIDASSPSGKTYRRKAITGRRTKKLLALGLKKSGKTRVITGYQYHKASAKGQAPAKDSKSLYKSVRVTSRGKTKKTIAIQGHAYYLDPMFKGQPNGGGYLDRPFLQPALEIAVNKLPIFNQL